MTETGNEHKQTITLQGSWILVNNVEEAEEATALDKAKTEEKEDKDNNDSDLDSDGISVISETQFLDSNTDDETPVKKGSESSSDENSSSKWTFVEDAAKSEEPSNKFYLDCMQEPVQELSEQELGSINSDLESDGVSIISETDDYLQDNSDVSTLDENRIIKENTNNNSFDWFDLNNYYSLVVFSTVFIAVISICLSPYFASSSEDLSVFDEKTIETVKKYDIADPVVYCREKHKNDGIYREINAKKCRKCLKKVENGKSDEMDNKHEDYLKRKEEYLRRKEEFLKQKEHELHKVEKLLKKHKIVLPQEDDGAALLDNNNKKIGKHSKERKGDKSHKKQLKHEFDKNKDKIKKSGYKKGDFEGKDYKNFRKISKKYSEVPEHTQEHKKYNNKPLKIKKDDIKKLKREDLLKKKDKKKLNTEIDTVFRLGKANHKKNKTLTGHWYNELHKARYNFRRSEHESDWVFDRANLRQQKRNKALWYFNWMGDRETNRYKKFSH